MENYFKTKIDRFFKISNAILNSLIVLIKFKILSFQMLERCILRFTIFKWLNNFADSFLIAKSRKPIRASDCYLTPNEQFFNYIMARKSYIQWDDDDDDDDCFVLDQQR